MMPTVALDINILLDRSSSMLKLQPETIAGYNRFLADQQLVPGAATVSLYQFDTNFEIIYERIPVGEAPMLDCDTFVPRGFTSLNDAIMSTLKLIESSRKLLDAGGKVVVVVSTDGQENTSRKFTTSQVKEAIEAKTAQGWTFVYLGANQDAWAVGNDYGFERRSTMSTAANADGVRSMYNSVSASMTAMRTGSDADYRFKQEDFDAQTDAGASVAED